MTEYERAVLDRLLQADFRGAEATRKLALNARVFTMDECGCLEFERPSTSTHGVKAEVVAEGVGPRDADGIPVDITLTLTGDHPLWLEFHRYSGANDFWPDPGDWVVSPDHAAGRELTM